MTDSFTELRPLLFSIAYRMTGTRVDAEDVLQESYLRWQAADRNGIQSPKAFLTTVVARLSLDSLKAAHRKREVYVGPWLPEPIVGPVTEPVELAESLSFAFLHLLESLPPQERVAFLLREVFDSDYKEVSATLETTEANARQLVSRAREHLRAKRPRKQAVDPERHRELLNEFLRACAVGDVGGLVGMLKQDATLYSDGGGKTRAALMPIYGADKIIRFVCGLLKKGLGVLSAYPVEVNGAPGAVVTIDGNPHTLVTIEIEDGKIGTVFYVLNPDKLGTLANSSQTPS